MKALGEVPRYMNRGSNGPHVVLLQVFLIGARFGKNIMTDGDYGHITAAGVVRFQEVYGLEADGHFGPGTRERVKKNFGFDFEAACRAVPGVTRFVQPDAIVMWGPDQSA